MWNKDADFFRAEVIKRSAKQVHDVVVAIGGLTVSSYGQGFNLEAYPDSIINVISLNVHN